MSDELYGEFYDHCRKGDVGRVTFYLSAKLSATWTNRKDRNRSLLMASAWKDSDEVCKLLVLALASSTEHVNHQDASRMTVLHICAKQNSHRVARQLLQCADIDPNVKSENGITPLMICADLGHTEVGSLLINHRAIQLDLQSDRGFSALMKAVFEKSEELAVRLIEKGACLDLASQGGFTALHLCAQLNRTDLAKQMLSRQLSSDLINRPTKPEFKGNTAFTLAALNGHMEMLKLLREKGADISLKSSEDATALDQVRHQGSAAASDLVQLLESWYNQTEPAYDLCSAIRANDLQRVRQLIANGAPDAGPKAGPAPLMIAAAHGNLEILRLLLDSPGIETNINLKNASCGNTTALHAALRSGKKDCVELLLERGARLGIQDDSGANLLHLCAELNASSSVTQLLLNKSDKSDLQAQNMGKFTPIEVSAVSGSLEALELLLMRQYPAGKDSVTDKDVDTLTGIRELANKHKQFRAADLVQGYIPSKDKKDEDGQKISQLFTAALDRNTNAVGELLQAAGQLINERCPREPRWTALMATAWNDDEATCELLLNLGANPNVKDEKLGITALHIAIQQNSEKVAKKLLEVAKIDTNVCSKDERTPLIRAAWLDRLAIGMWLLKKKADVNAKEQEGFSALHFCAQENLLEFATQLIHYDADLELQTTAAKNSNTAFTLATIMGHYDMMVLLANVGADIYHRSSRGDAMELTMELAKKAKRDYVVELLQQLDRERDRKWTSVESPRLRPDMARQGSAISLEPKPEGDGVETDCPRVALLPNLPADARDLNSSTVPPIPPIYGEEYSMRSNPRGICVIINNERFPDPKHNRTGSHIDVEQLKKLFRDTLKFHVQVHWDLDACDIWAVMQTLASDDRHAKYDCFAAFIMTHGENGVVQGCDGGMVPLKKIFELFRHCRSLRQKPKLFFIQACRIPSAAAEANVDMAARPAGGTAAALPSDILPSDKRDFLFAYATTEGDYALRSPDAGSLYVQSLCKVVAKRYRQKHLCDMLNLVRAKLGKKTWSVVVEDKRSSALNISSETTQLQATVWFRDHSEL